MLLHFRTHREAEDDGRDDEADRGAVALYERAVLHHVKARHDHLRRADADRARHEQVECVDVEVGEYVQEHVVAANGHGREELLLVRREVGMRQHHSLREAGRAARVGERGEIVHPDLDGAAGRRFFGEKIVEALDPARRGVTGHCERTDLPELRSGGVHDRRECRVVEDRRRSRVVDLKTHFPFLRLRVDRIHDTAGLERAVERDHELDGVRHEDGHPVAGMDAAFGERRRQPVAQLVDLTEGHAAVAHEKRRLIADVARYFAQAVLQGDLAVGEFRRGLCRRNRHGALPVPSRPARF